MKKIIYICLAIAFCQMNLYSQKETNWWFFGNKSGLNFNDLIDVKASDGTTVPNMPKYVTGPFTTYEGSSVISTNNGDLLFSSDGRVVYNKSGQKMDNGDGLHGHPSATQAAVIIPKPGSITQYYVFVPPAYESNIAGLTYSIVDISLNGGSGKVIQKNTNLLTETETNYENIAAVPNPNAKDYWLIHRAANTFHVWAVTSSGITKTSTATIPGSIATGLYVGEVFLSRNYTKLIALNWTGNQVVSAEFNPSTGIISNINAPINMGTYTYGGCFSPDGEYYYIGTGFMVSLYSGKWADLRASKVPKKIAAGFSNAKLGPDDRIYGVQCVTNWTSTKNLHVLLDPNNGGTQIKTFPTYLTNGAYIGLPTFSAGFIRVIGLERPFSCAANDRTYNIEVDLSGGNTPHELKWDFGDSSSGITEMANPTQSIYSQMHVYSNPGNYTITVTPYKADGTPLEKIKMQATVVSCNLKSNIMTRSDLLNTRQQMK